MAVLTTALIGVGSMAGMVALEVGAARALRAAWLAYRPLSGEHTDSRFYERSLWTPGEPDCWQTLALLLVSGMLAAVALCIPEWPMLLALLPWGLALAWDLWTWQRSAASVKFVSWQRGWERSVRRVAVSDLREVQVVERRAKWPRLSPRWQPVGCQLVLVLRDGKAIKLPRTGVYFGGATRVENFANFVRLQIDVVADNRRRSAADKRAAARHALQAPPPPAHPATKLDPLALPRGL